MKKDKPKNNAGKVMDACKSIGVEVEPAYAQSIVNLMTRFGCKIIRRLVKPDEVIALLQDYLKSLKPTGKYLGVTDQIYDLTKERDRRGEIKEKDEQGMTRLKFKKPKR